MTKKHLTLFAATTILLISSCKQATKKATPNETDAEAIAKVEQLVQNVFDDIWAAKDTAAILKHHTTDFLLLEHGEVWTNDTISNWCKKAAIRDKGIQRTNSFDFFKARKEGNRIWMAYHNYATFTRDTLLGKGRWLESVVAIKKDSVWKLEMMHSTRIKQ